MRVAVKEIVRSLKTTGNISQTARSLGISRWTVARWKKKSARIYGYQLHLVWKGLNRKSTKPHRLHYKLDSKTKEQVLILKRDEHLGPKKIKNYLSSPVSHMTIHRFLEGQNLVEKQPNFRRPLFQNGFAMRPANTTTLGYLQMDTKHVTPELSGLPVTVFEYGAIDILSRYKLAVLLPDISADSARMALEYFLKWFPFPVAYIQTDNGLEYQAEFDQFCQTNHIQHYFIHKNSPNENAVIERSFKTDQEEFFYWLDKAPTHLGELNDWLQKFITKYNTWRLHQALGYKTPFEIVKLYQNQSVA